MARLAIDKIEYILSGRDVVLYFSMCLKAEIQALSVMCGL